MSTSVSVVFFSRFLQARCYTVHVN